MNAPPSRFPLPTSGGEASPHPCFFHGLTGMVFPGRSAREEEKKEEEAFDLTVEMMAARQPQEGKF